MPEPVQPKQADTTTVVTTSTNVSTPPDSGGQPLPSISAPQADTTTTTSTGTRVDHHDKILLAALIVFTYLGVMGLVWANADIQIITFATGTVTGLLGALIALLTGRK